MVRFYTLGQLGLIGPDGRSTTSVLVQPRRVALLAYLALAQPRGFHRRDKLLGLFWPELDEEHARGALNQATYMLRRSLGAEAVVSRGTEEVALGAGVWCDAAAFDDAVGEGRLEDAFALYRGPLLDGFFIADAPEFGEWLESERTRMCARVAEVAWQLAEIQRRRGHIEEACNTARRAAELQPGDEHALRRLVQFLTETGNRAAALRTYDEFSARLLAVYGLEPSAETVALINDVRAAGTHPPELLPPPMPISAAATPATSAIRSRLHRRVVAPLVASVAVMVLASWWHGRGQHGFNTRASATPASQSIAVLPFANVNADASTEYFSDGLSEELINALARVPGLRVPARTSSFAFKGVNTDVRAVGRQLNVGYVVEGSVRITGPRVRVNAHLIDVNTGYHVWSEAYDRNVEDIFDIQQEISSAIAHTVLPRLTAGASAATAPTRDIDAYRSYLRGRALLARRTVDDTRQALQHFEDAVRRDPGFALAHAGVGDAHALLPYYRAAGSHDALARAEAAALRAIELDSMIAEPHTTLGWINFTYRWNWRDAEQHFAHALRLNPSDPIALHFYSLYLARVAGRHQQAIALAARAQTIDPLSPQIHTGAGAVYYHARLYDRAIEAHQHALALDSAYYIARYFLGKAYLASGRLEEAIATLSRDLSSASTGDRRAAIIAYAYFRTGRQQEGLRVMHEAQGASPTMFAILYTALGDHDRAFAMLERAAAEHETRVVEIQHEPLLDPLRSDPRFRRIAQKVGLPDR